MPSVSRNKPSKKVIDALTFDLPKKHDQLNKASNAPLTLTYTFDSAGIGGLDTGYSGWQSFSAGQKAAVEAVLAEYETFLNVRFVASAGGGDKDLYFGRTNLGSLDGFGGISWKKTASSFDLDGFAMWDTSVSFSGTYAQHLLVHEIGHAMTLKHPGRYGSDEEGPFLKKSKESNKFSVMSYKDNPDSGELAAHLMLYDVAALQKRFGANLEHRTGDDVYTGPAGPLEVLWDAGGTDIIDGSGYTTRVKIDLRDGRFSSLGEKANLAIAFGAVIENATGGSGSDKLVGNRWKNVLSGGPGDDRIDGGKGSDILAGGPGADVFVFSAKPGKGRDTITDLQPGVDIIRLDRDDFARIGGKGTLKDGKFHLGSEAHDKSDRIVYDDQSGHLIHDRNGSGPGKAKVFAVVDAGLDIGHELFIVA